MTTPNGPTNGPEVGIPPGRVVEADLPPSSPWHKATWVFINSSTGHSLFVDLRPEIGLEYAKRVDVFNTRAHTQEKCRYTSERSNISLCPLQILRGFGALHLLASGKTEKAISDIITQGGGYGGCAEMLGAQIWLSLIASMALNCLADVIVWLFLARVKKEQKTDSDEEVEKKRVINAVCFATNPDGNTTVALMENDLMRATKGKIKYAIRHDLAPNWRTRLILITAFDGTFYWHPPAPVEVKLANFYESYTRNAQFRSVLLIPQFTIVSPLSLRPAFDKPTALFHRPSPFPRAWRIFSAQKAEFSKIIGEPKYFGATYTFPLWDHYHKTKFSVR
uniref:Uncharacterized protein n=1 Tax=Ascaris lumbricoides TaxID=6252 RepID=A0A0M3II00_ASCLU